MAIISRMPDHHFVIITLIRKYQSDYLLMAFSENLVFSNQTFNPSTKTNTHTHTQKKEKTPQLQYREIKDINMYRIQYR